MTNQPNQVQIEFSWQDILWRIFITVMLLMLLALASITVFSDATTSSDAYVLPSLPYAVTVQ